MEALYHQTNQILIEIEQGFQNLMQKPGLQDTQNIEKEIQMKITSANSNCDRLDVLLYKTPASHRQSAKMRVDQLKYDIRHLQNSLQLYNAKRHRSLIEQTEREQLLSHRFTTNSTQETCLDIDNSLQHHSQLNSANHGIDDMMVTGSQILGSLINQREALKGAQSRLYAIGNTLGLSNHTMKLVENRFTEDKYIMVFGMVATLFIISLIIYFVVF